MLKIAGNRNYLYQWDLNQRVLVIDDDSVNEVHFANEGQTEDAPIVEVKQDEKNRYADIPNILLQSGKNIVAYEHCNVNAPHTIRKYKLVVIQRPKPSDYVYTETEVKAYETLRDQINEIDADVKKKLNAPLGVVGEFLAVEEVDENGIATKVKTQKVETEPSDWNENDSKNPGFIKNRTHYKQHLAGAGNPGYKLNLLDGAHKVGDVVLLQSCTTNLLQKIIMRGINSPDEDAYELCMLIKRTYNNGRTSDLEKICKDAENIVEVNTLSEGNIKVLYSEVKKTFLAYYFISNLSTLGDDDKTKFTQTGVYVQLAGNDYAEYSELWATYRLYVYSKLSNKYLNIQQTALLPAIDDGEPTTETKGVIGQMYYDKTGKRLYVCTDATNGYTWQTIEAEATVDVDSTLTKSGKAADAKAVGDALAEKLGLADLPKYDGTIEVIPDTANAQVLRTAQKYMESDITVKKVPYAEITNLSGGKTATIGSEV